MNIIDKYLLNKRKKLVNYSKKLSEFITTDGLVLLKNKTELNKFLNIIIEKYINDFYLSEEESYILVGDFFNYDTKGNKEINQILYLIYNYFNSIDKDNLIYEKDIYYASVICSLSININNLFNGNKKSKDYAKTINKLISEISKNKVLKIRKNKNQKAKELVKIIKESVEDERKFFSYFEMPEIFNKFRKVKTLENSYFVKYRFVIDTEKFKRDYVEKIFKREKINDLYLLISYELLLITMLKIKNLGDKNTSFIVPITKGLCNNETDVNKLNKIFNKTEIKNKVKFLIDSQMITNEPRALGKLISSGFKVCIMTEASDMSINSVEIIKENENYYLYNNKNLLKEEELLERIKKEEISK